MNELLGQVDRRVCRGGVDGGGAELVVGALLPIPNTTVEMLAEMLTDRLRAEFETAGAKGVTAIEMEVEENFGQSAVYRVGLSS